jgi:D-citramalate synthase
LKSSGRARRRVGLVNGALAAGGDRSPASRAPRSKGDDILMLASASKPRHVEIMDTTLRDGEQTEGVSMIAEEKLAIARALIETLRVDRIEVASARVSSGELATVQKICRWAKSAKMLDRVEILGFTDGKRSVDWAVEAGCKTINLLTKGSRKHCQTQLGKTLEEHLADIEKTVRAGLAKGLAFNVYLEDWSGGMLDSPDYVWAMLDRLVTLPFRRLMLPDTLGILEPAQVADMVGQVVRRHPKARIDFHAHNDYGLATANCLAALQAGARGLHVTINGLGERAGNAPLDEVVVAVHDFANYRTRVIEKNLQEVSRLTEAFTGKRIAWNKPITGEGVFTQTAGIHADGDKKGGLYENRLTPQRFRRQRSYAMGKLMGKASLDLNLAKLGIQLDAEQKTELYRRIVSLADAKKVVTTEDLPFMISDMLQTRQWRFLEIKDFMISTNHGLSPVATVLVRFGGQDYQVTASGDGGFDAFMKALRSLEKPMGFKLPKLVDYTVRIPPGGRSDALVETTIHWEGGLKTRGVNSDQLVAAIEAATRMMNVVAAQVARARG